MKSKPVRKYASPKYPTRTEVAARPGLLQRHQPPAWRNWPEMTGAVGLFLLADTARLVAADSPTKSGQTKAQSQALAVVAPIFQHGEGRGSTGCIVMSPPIFLSEEEALQVIRQEMASKGVKLGTNETMVAGVHYEGWKEVNPGVPKTQYPFKASSADPGRKVVVDFVSEGKARNWDFELQIETGKMTLSTAQSYDLPKTAADIANRVKRQATEKVYFGTFYDPIAGTLSFAEEIPQEGPKSLPELIKTSKAESLRLLRLQVQDFLKWLQAQGAI